MKYKVIGDVHDNKATVLIEENGEQWIRKPGSAAAPVAYKAFLSRLGEEGFLYIPGTVHVLSRGEEEYDVSLVEQVSVSSADEVSMYYKRSGAMLFFAYLFSAKDLHDENIIAQGAYPTIVDYETLLGGQINRGGFNPGRGTPASVLGTHLLSQWMRVDGCDVEIGGLTGEAGNRNVLLFEGRPVHSYDHAEEIGEGFRYAYDFVMERADLVGRLLHVFDNCSFRVILRPSQAYTMIGERIKKLEEAQREPYVKKLLELAYVRDIDPNRVRQARKSVTYEAEAVLNGEIPLFFVPGNGKDLRNRKGIVWKDFLKLSPVEHAERRLMSLSATDRDCQLRIIEQALLAVKPVSLKPEEVSDAAVKPGSLKPEEVSNAAVKPVRLRPDVSVPGQSMGQAENSIMRSEADRGAAFLSAARLSRDLLERIERSGIETLDSGWLRLNRSDYGRLCLQSVGFGLYDGLLGILCAYAAVYHQSREHRILEKIISRYEKYRNIVMPSVRRLDGFRSGLQEGIGGHLLALRHLHELTGLELFLSDGKKILETVRLAGDRPQDLTDVLGGYAGLALALPYIGTRAAKDLAEELGRKLSGADVRLTGMAHGAAGYALALGAVGHVLKSDVYDSRILELLRWEDSYYNETEHNWADLRSAEKCGYMFGWCSGAPGIGMARKRLYEYTENEEIRAICIRDIESVKTALRTKGAIKRDGLCCGNSAYLMAASALGICADDVFRELERRVNKARINLVHPAGTCDQCAGLMQGLAGVCYALAMYGDEMSGGMLC